MLKPEEINGKMYQPVETDDENFDCMNCQIFHDINIIEGCTTACTALDRDDDLDVYYINIEGE